MPSNPVLYADADPDFCESLYNHLLLSGYEEIEVARDEKDLRRLLSTSFFSLVFLDYELYNCDDVKTLVDRYRNRCKASVILLLDEEEAGVLHTVLKARDVYLCIPKASIRQFLARSMED